MTLAISLHDISKRFIAPTRRRAPLYRQLTRYVRTTLDSNQRLALDRISVDLPQGQIVGIVGANGAGKSTLLRVMCGIHTPSSGSRHIHGRIACHFGGEAGLAPTLKVTDNLLLFGAMLGMSHAETSTGIDSILDLADLPGEHSTRLEHLSFGKQQRLFFGVMLRAMQLGKAEIFLFDEWLAGADRRYQDQAEHLLKSLRVREQTVIVSSHDVDRLHRLCDLVIYLHQGQVRQFGAAAPVLEQYRRDCA